jgi:hypothetical protein
MALFLNETPNRLLTKWRLALSDYVFDVRYRPGTQNTMADVMSRLESEGCLNDGRDMDIPTLLVELKSILAGNTERLRPLQVE